MHDPDTSPPAAHSRLESLLRDATRVSKERYVLDQHAIVSVTDHRGIITEVNDKFCAISGYTREELIGRTHALLKSGRHADAFYGDMWATIRQGQPWHGVICNRRKDGRYYWVQSSIVPLCNELGDPCEYISIRTDITHIKEAEEGLRLFERGVSASASGILICDACLPGMPVTYVNPAYLKMSGYTADELMGLACAGQAELLPGIAAPSMVIRQSLADQRGARMVLADQRKDESIYHVDVKTSPVYYEQGVLSHFVTIVNDVTELTQAMEDAERASAVKSEFLSSMSHELRTPLNAILGFAQLLEIDMDLSRQQARQVHQIAAAGHHLLSLINDVLNLSKLESESDAIHQEAVPLAQVAAECMALVQVQAQARALAVTSEVPMGLLVLGERTRIKQVLINLLSNAVKYNRRGGQVHLSVTPIDHLSVRINIQDTGTGLTKDQLTHLFKPFTRLGQDPLAEEGTGIGLMICKRLIEMMGGRIGVLSEPDEGSTFWIELPIATP